MIKCETWQQKKILEHIESQFEMDCITVEIFDKDKLMVTDKNGDSLIFFYYHDQIIPITVV